MSGQTTRRTLIVMRHGDAEPARAGRADHERSLTASGRAAAASRAALIKAHEPDLVICSDASRTRQTLAALELVGVDVRYERRAYNADHVTLLQLLAEVDAAATSVLVVGHLPGVSDLVRDLARPSQRGGISFSPATVGVLEMAAPDWALLTSGSAAVLSLTG